MNIKQAALAIILIAAAVLAIIAITHTPENPTEPTVSLAKGGEITIAMGHRMWPDGTIIHKELDNGWVCVEIDKHHLLVYTGGKSGFGVAVDSCIVE